MTRFSNLLAILTLCCVPATADPVTEKIDWAAMLERHDLAWDRMPRQWTEAPFLGNGEQGTMMRQLDPRTIRWDVGCSATHDHRPMDNPDPDQGDEAVLNRGRHFIDHLRLVLPVDLTGVEARLKLWDAEATGTFRSEGGRTPALDLQSGIRCRRELQL